MAAPTQSNFLNLTKALVGNNEETGKSAAATVLLVNALNSTLNAQETLAKSFVSTGRSVDMFAANVDIFGMNLVQSAKLFAEINSEGIRQGRDQIAANLGIASLLGKNTKGMASLLAFNEQALGATGAQNANLIAATTELGANFQVDSDKLVAAMQKLGQTLISAAATYGQQSGLAIQQATSQLVAELGTGAEGLVTSVMNKIAAGTAEAGKLAAILGVDTAAFRGTDPTQIANTVREMMATIGERFGNFRGQQGSEFVIGPLMQALGLDANFLVLSDAMERGFLEQNSLTQEQLKQQILQENINTSIAETQKAFQQVLLPFIKGMAKASNFVVEAMGGTLIPIIQTIVVALGTAIAVLSSILLVQKLMLITDMFKGLPFIGKFLAGALGLTAIGFGIGALVGIASDNAETSTSIADETKAQTEMMRADRNTSNSLLSNISTNIALLNALNEQQLSELEEANKLAPGGINLNMGGGVHESLDPGQSAPHLRR